MPDENTLVLTREQFDTLINLPRIKDMYRFYSTQKDKACTPEEPNSWFKLAGITFIVE